MFIKGWSESNEHTQKLTQEHHVVLSVQLCWKTDQGHSMPTTVIDLEDITLNISMPHAPSASLGKIQN